MPACVDADLECLAAAAQQLRHVERLDLGDVVVRHMAVSGVYRFRDCVAPCSCIRCFRALLALQYRTRR